MGCTVEVWEGINNFTLHFMIDVITYPSRQQNEHDYVRVGEYL